MEWQKIGQIRRVLNVPSLGTLHRVKKVLGAAGLDGWRLLGAVYSILHTLFGAVWLL